MQGSTYDTGVVLEVQEDTVETLPGLGLANDDGGVDLLAEFGLSLLDGGHDHVTDTTGRQSVEAGTDTLDGDDVKVTGTRVVGAVHDGTTEATESATSSNHREWVLSFGKRGEFVHGKTEGHLELATGGTATVEIWSALPRLDVCRNFLCSCLLHCRRKIPFLVVG